MKVRKAIIPVAGLATRFIPLSKAVPKELLPLVDKPAIQYLVEEAIKSGIKEIVFVVNPQKRGVLDYFEKAPKLEKILEEKKEDELLEKIKDLEEISKEISFSYVVQKEQLGDGHAILQAKKIIGNEPFAVFFCDDIIDSKKPCLLQLLDVYKTCEKPVIALRKVPKEKTSLYGIVETEKIANRFHKIKKIVEKPSIGSVLSDIAIVGRYVLTPEVFEYLGKVRSNKKGELILAKVLMEMVDSGKIIYGYEIEGEWLECGNKLGYLKSNIYLSLKHPEFGPELKNIFNKYYEGKKI